MTLLEAPELLVEWTRRTLRARYQQSLLGWLWALIQPAAQVAIFTVVFTRFVPVDTGETPYVAFSYVATVPWAFLAQALTDMTNSLVDNISLVSKVYFPREVLPIASMLARLVDFVVASALFAVLALYFRIPALSVNLAFLPVILLVQILMVTGIGLAGAALNVFVRDVRSVLVLAIQVWFYASPVLYPVSTVPESIRFYYSLNPMVGIIEGYRAVLLQGQPPRASFLVAAAGSAAIFIVGYALFKKLEFQFADVV